MIARRRRNRIGGPQPKRTGTPNSPAPPSDQMPPRLIKIGSMSSSSSNDSPPHQRSMVKSNTMISQRARSTSRGRNRIPFLTSQKQRKPSTDPPGTKGSHRQPHHPTIRDSSILKGAEILRRELTDAPAKQHSHEAWDPWRIPTAASTQAPKSPQEEISELTMNADDAAYWAARPNVGQGIYEDVADDYESVGGQNKNHRMEDFGGQAPQQQHYQRKFEEKKTDESNMGSGSNNSNNVASNIADDDTMSVLERAMTFFGASSVARSAETDQSKSKQQNVFKNHSAPPSLVQRVSDLEDTKSFASMFTSSFLPAQLLSASFGTNQKSPIEDEEEELETSTLDYIASMYTQKHDSTGIIGQRSNASAQVQPTRPRTSTQETSRSERLMKNPRVTEAATPFERMVVPSSYFYDELMRDPAYQHAAKAGILWQSLCSQHVRFPALWWDGDEPASPPMGTPEKQSWRYLGRHRVKADQKLNSMIGNRGSSGRILLHLIVRDDVTCEPIEDICCGCFHPNARGIRMTPAHDPQVEDCRDVWIGHRRRFQGKSLSTLESLLKRQNKNRVFASPLGGPKSSSTDIGNGNLKAVFGEKPPLFTVFVTESEIFELLRTELKGGSPASVVLLRRYLRYRIG
ncbi:hypothetical protein IV203_016804 [Nitzschia inconspicua]|uniref:Uncharacterized protein n=1 Tax=Nitzschia inconspicua TaxID=303405 RepID=A0A9K3KRT0_9STRA|nr:hypothetical protein IV203_016804 [Nitzschia inconspicua]